MSAFLSQTRNQSSFAEKIRSKSPGTQKCTKTAMRNFERFAKKRHVKSIEETVAEYQKVERDLVYDSLQEWINWNHENGLGANTIPAIFSYLKSYLRYHKIKITKEDVAEQLNFPHKIKEERYPPPKTR